MIPNSFCKKQCGLYTLGIMNEELTPPEVPSPDFQKQKPLGFRGFLRILGPGLITGAADDDPSGIAT